MTPDRPGAGWISVSERSVVLFSLVAEGATGVLVVLAPDIVARLLFGVEVDVGAALYGSLLGMSLLALVIACWPRGGTVPRAAVQGLLAYNVLAMGYLAYIGTVLTTAGILLWLAVVEHALVALLLAVLGRDQGAKS